MTEVDYGGGGTTHGWKQSTCVSMGCPTATYIKEGREEVAGPRRARQVWGILLGLPSPSRIPLLFPIPSRRRREGGRGEKEGGGRHPLLVQFGRAHGEGCSHPLRPFSPFPYGPLRPNMNSRNSPVLRKIPESLGTFLISEYSLPIYRSLRLDHLETPCHVPDIIQDSKQTSVIKSHN